MDSESIQKDIWHTRMMRLAEEVATWSKEKHQVGCVITSKNNIILGTGYNGPPRNIEKNKGYAIHAEMNAIINYNRNFQPYNIYIYPYSPCSYCAGFIIQVGIKQVFIEKVEGPKLSFWHTDQVKALEMLKEAGVYVN